MKNLRNKNQPPNADLVQLYLESSWDIVTAVYNKLAQIQAIAAALTAGTIDDFLTEEDIDTLAKLNIILTDATLGTAADFATAAQGLLADTAIQGPFASQAEAEAGADNTKAMSPLRVAQAIAVLAAGIQNNFAGAGAPTINDDSGDGYVAGSVWIDTTANPKESYRCADPTAGAAVWLKTTLTADELATIALTGNSDDLIQGTTKLLMTVTERSKLAAIEASATADMTGAEIKVALFAEADTNNYNDAAVSKLAGIEASATADQSDSEIVTAYTNLTPIVTQGQAELGTSTTALRWTPERVAQAIAALGGGPGGGGLIPEFKTASFVAEAGKAYFIDSAGGAVAVTLPAGVDLNNILLVNSTASAATNHITITPNGVETIGGDATFVIDQNWGQVNIAYQSAQTDWEIAPIGTPEFVVGEGTALEAEIQAIASKYKGINSQVGTTYELVLADAGKLVTMDNGAANTLTIPANASVAFDVGTRIDVMQKGAGQTTVAITTDTLNGAGGLKINAQWETISLLKIAATHWVLVGGVA